MISRYRRLGYETCTAPLELPPLCDERQISGYLLFFVWMIGSGDLIGLAFVYGYVTLVVGIALFLDRMGVKNCRRKVIHILVGNIVLLWWVFDTAWIMALLAAAPFIPLLFLVSPRSSNRFLKKSFLGRATGEGHDLGLVYYAISWTLLAFFLFDHRLAASVGIACMAYGDGMGGLVGRCYGRRRLLGEKTLEGSIAILITTVVAVAGVMLFYRFLDSSGVFPSVGLDGIFILQVSLFLGIYVAGVELITPGKYDNLIIPISTALILVALGL